MGRENFYIDFNIEVPNMDEDFTIEADRELRDLAAQHSDIVGAAVSLESIVEGERPYLYQVRIVVYKRPQYMAVVEKNAIPMDALRDALTAIQERVRTSREKLAEVDTFREDEKHTVAYELSDEEVYATYIENENPSEIFDQGRTEIATRLMVTEGLNQEAAYMAADKILQVALQRMNEEN